MGFVVGTVAGFEEEIALAEALESGRGFVVQDLVVVGTLPAEAGMAVVAGGLLAVIVVVLVLVLVLGGHNYFEVHWVAVVVLVGIYLVGFGLGWWFQALVGIEIVDQLVTHTPPPPEVGRVHNHPRKQTALLLDFPLA